MLLYHATTYDNMRLILGHITADPEFDEVNGFKGGRVSGFEDCVFLSEQPIDFGCVGGTYHIVIDIDISNIDECEWRYFEDDDNYNCKNYAVPAKIVNQCEMWLLND